MTDTTARILVLGGTGYAGTHLVREAAGRGHAVIAASRTAPESLPEGAEHRVLDLQGDALAEDLAALLDGVDVVVATSSPRGDLTEQGVLRARYATLAAAAREAGARLGVIGGAGSLQVSEDGPLLVDTPDFPEAFQQEARELTAVLEDLRGSADGLDWFFLSPAAGFGAHAPGERTGSYRTGGDVLLADEQGRSELSGEDLAVAVLDEIERPAHRRERFTVAY